MKTPENNYKIIRMMFGKPKEFVFFVISTIIVALTEIFLIISSKNYIDTLKERNEIVSITVLTVIVLFINLIIFLTIRNITKTNISLNIRNKLINNAEVSVLNGNISDLEKEDVKKYINNIIANSNIISDYIKNNILLLIQKVICFICFSITSVIVQPLLALITFISLPFYYMGLRTVDLALNKLSKKALDLETKNEEKVNYVLDVIKDIKLKDGIQLEKDDLNDMINNESNVLVRKSFLELVSKCFISILFEGIVIAICFGLTGFLYKTGNSVTTGTIFYYIITTPILFGIIYNCMHMKISSSHISKECFELDYLNNLHSEIKSEPITSLDEIHNFKFKEVSLRCGDSYILNNITFELKKGEKLGILSNDRLSKNAILDIISKIIKDHTGEVLINNCEINKICTSHLRKIISFISYDNIVFDKTILENIIYPEKFDEYKYNDALNRSGLKDIVSHFPNKGETYITEDLENYQDIKRRVVFANAFYHDSKIYIFNDATSDYNPLLEHELFDEIYKLKNKLIINMTDKPYLLNNSDKILIIEDGNIVEYGKYEDLINDKTSQYYKMIKKVVVKKTKIS